MGAGPCSSGRSRNLTPPRWKAVALGHIYGTSKTLIAVFCALLLFPVLVAVPQDDRPDDVENCADHPMFNRMPNMYIQECSKDFNLVEVPMSTSETTSMEGTKSLIQYGYSEAERQAPSFYQIVKNYENAISKSGGKRVYYSAETGQATLSLRSNGKDLWVMLDDGSGGRKGDFVLIILEVEAMKQEIKADAVLDELNKSGMIALHINFETGRTAIESESQSIIDQMSKMLQDNPSLKVSIEGHTDNVGTPAANKKLSEDRAASALAALVSSSVIKERLSSKGWGQERPVADNTSEDGRAKNRRVEIVKLQ